MKNFGRSSTLSFGSVLLATLWLFSAAAQAATPGAAQVKKVVGNATYTDTKGGGPIREGAILMEGATITTGAGSYVDLDMGVNGNALRVEADSTLSLNKLEYTKAGETIVNTQLEVKKGAAVANVINKLSKASKYEIKTPAGVAGIRGTVLRAGATRIVCLIGRVEFRTVNGQLQLVIGGTAVSVGGGVVKAATVETTGLARSACSLTTNTAANMVNATVQQFTTALAAEAASEAGKAGGNSATAAAQAAKAIMAELILAVQEAAAQAPPAVRAAALAAAANLARTSETLQTTSAAGAAAAATVANGGTKADAQAAAQQAAQQSTSNPAIVRNALANVAPGINSAIQIRSQGGTAADIMEGTAERTNLAAGGSGTGGGTGGGTGTTTDTEVGETKTFTSGTTGAPPPK